MTHPLTALALRVEQSKGADLLLFREIGNAVFGIPTGDEDNPYDVDTTTAPHYEFERLIQAGASLDAAMLLVPEGCGVHTASEYSNRKAKASNTFALSGRHWARVYTPQHGSFETTATTPALALTAAALRAIAAKEDGDTAMPPRGPATSTPRKAIAKDRTL